MNVNGSVNSNNKNNIGSFTNCYYYYGYLRIKAVWRS